MDPTIPQTEVAPAQTEPTQAPPQDSVEALRKQFAEEKAALQEQLQAQMSIAAKLAAQSAPAPVATNQPDPYAPLKAIGLTDEQFAAFRAVFDAQQAEMQRITRQAQGYAKKSEVAQLAASAGQWAVDLAQKTYEEELARGSAVDPQVIASWAIGQAVIQGKYAPGQPVRQAPVAPGMSTIGYQGVPPPPPQPRKALPPNIDSLPRAQRVALYEQAGLADLPI